MRNLLLAGLVAVSGIAFIAPASAQSFAIDTPVGGGELDRIAIIATTIAGAIAPTRTIVIIGAVGAAR